MPTREDVFDALERNDADEAERLAKAVGANNGLSGHDRQTVAQRISRIRLTNAVAQPASGKRDRKGRFAKTSSKAVQITPEGNVEER